MKQNSWEALFVGSCLAGSVLLYRGGWAIHEASGSERWPTTPGRILNSGALLVSNRSGGHKSWTYELQMSYDYVVNNTHYTGHRLRFSAWGPKENFNPSN